MIELKGVTKVFRTSEIETVALENVNLTVQKGEFVAVMGPSGCGKSTLLNIMGLLDVPTEGFVQVADTDTKLFSDSALAAFRNRTLGFVFQSFHLINTLTLLVTGHTRLTAADFEQQAGQTPALSAVAPAPASAATLEEMERLAIKKVYQQCHGNMSAMARALGISRAALYRRIEKYGLF